MRNTVTAIVFSLLMVLSGLLAAQEPQDDEEKITMPRSVPPDTSGPVTIVPSPSSPGATTVLTPSPTQVPPSPETGPPDKTSPVEVPVVPVLPDKTTPVEVPVVPVLPDKTTPVEVPVVPVLPDKTAPVEIPVVPPDKTIIVTPTPETTPPQKVIVPQPVSPEPPAEIIPDKQASPVDFLPMPTSLVPEKTPSEPKVGKDKQPSKEPSKEPAKERPVEPKTQTPPKTTPAKPKSGAPLRIPPGAAKSGDLSFLEGCWRGTRPEYNTKRIITERFCFGKNGVGKRTIEDPGIAGRCTGATKGRFDAQGKLIVTSENGYCTGGAQWGPAYMVCQGEGNATPCYWRFPAAGGGSQNYKIPLVRE